MAEYIVAIDVTRVRFPADALSLGLLIMGKPFVGEVCIKVLPRTCLVASGLGCKVLLQSAGFSIEVDLALSVNFFSNVDN